MRRTTWELDGHYILVKRRSVERLHGRLSRAKFALLSELHTKAAFFVCVQASRLYFFLMQLNFSEGLIESFNYLLCASVLYVIEN